MGATFSSYLATYRETYWREAVTDLWFETDKRSCPLLAMMETKQFPTGMGRKFIVPVEYLPGSSVSATFADAQSKAQGSTLGSGAEHTRWEVDAVEYQGVAVFDRQAVDATEGKPNDAIDIIDREMKSKMAVMKQRLAIASHESGFGRVATITAITTSTITIATTLINRVREGDELVAAASETSGGLRSATAIRVTAVDPDTGVVTLAADPTALSWATNDTVFQKGDRNAGATRIVPTGWAGWVPTAAPAATAFFGVDRTLSQSTLGGLRFNATGLDIAAGLIRGCERLVKMTGTAPSHVLVSNEDYATLTIDRDATKIVDIQLGKYKIGFSGFVLQTYAGNIPVIPDVYIPSGRALVGPFDDKRFAPFIAHNRDLVNIDNLDGLDFRALATATSYEVRMYFRGNYVFPAPGKFLHITNLGA